MSDLELFLLPSLSGCGSYEFNNTQAKAAMKIVIVEIKPLSGGGFVVEILKDGQPEKVSFGPGDSKKTSDLHRLVMDAVMELIRPALGP